MSVAPDEINIRLILRTGNTVSDDLYELDAADLFGTIPQPGDYIMQMLKGVRPDCYRVVDRIFETGGRTRYVTLVVEEKGESYLRDIDRYSK